MKLWEWIKDQVSMEHTYQCTHCGKENTRVTEVSWYYSAYAPQINYPLKRKSIHENWLCKKCWRICSDNYFDPRGVLKEYARHMAESKQLTPKSEG